MAQVQNTKKQTQCFWSDEAKKHGIKSGQVQFPPKETTEIPDSVLAEIQKNKFFQAMVEDGELVVKKDKQAAKDLEAKLKAETGALKAQAKANAAADEEARKAEDQAIKAMKDAIVDLGMERKSLNSKNLKALESIYENLKKAAQ